MTAPEKNAAARRTYSISNDIGPDVNEHHRLPRIGWQNNRQDFLVSDEGNISVKEQSPVRLPRTGQAPRREFSFSNLSAVYNAQEQPLPNKSREPTHFEFGDGTDEPPAAVKPKGGATSGYYHDLYAAGEEKEKPKSTARSGQGAHDGHFEFGDAGEETPRPTSSKGGGTGGYYHDLYDAAEEKAPAKSTARGSHARHDSHFEFGDDTYESVPAKSTARSSHGKHDSHFEFDDGANDVAAPIKPSKGGGTGGYYHDLYEPLDENSKPKSTARSGQGAHARGLQHETIFLDNADFTSKPPTKKSIGGGTGGRRPEETIFVEQDDQPLPTKKNPVIRRDQQHFQFGPDSIPSTPVQATRRVINDKQFSIESTPDPRDEEYRARALQKKQVNHFRPDTIPNFSFADASPAETGKKENTEGMNKLLKGMGRSWTMGADSPSVSKESQRVGIPQKGLTPHFSFGGDSPAEEEKENGRANTKRYKSHWDRINFRMHVPVVTEEKEWWET